jgi:hypothetical protein
MPRSTTLSMFALAVSCVTAGAADLPPQSRLGAIFAEPAEPRPYAVRQYKYHAPIIAYNAFPNMPWASGGYYYGSPYYYYRHEYYGGPYQGSGFRLPYVCGLYGYC